MKTIFNHFLLGISLVFSASSCATAEPAASIEEMPVTVESLPASEVSTENWSERAQEVLINALSLSGIRYKYGGNSPETGFDCSGFVSYVFKQATSLTLPRSALAMSRLGTTVPKSELKPGDLVFFNTLKSAFSHVGIYVGDNRFIHSPRSGGSVRIESMENSYWSKRFNGAQRLESDKEVSK